MWLLGEALAVGDTEAIERYTRSRDDQLDIVPVNRQLSRRSAGLTT
jgi:hypothetical protein